MNFEKQFNHNNALDRWLLMAFYSWRLNPHSAAPEAGIISATSDSVLKSGKISPREVFHSGRAQSLQDGTSCSSVSLTFTGLFSLSLSPRVRLLLDCQHRSEATEGGPEWWCDWLLHHDNVTTHSWFLHSGFVATPTQSSLPTWLLCATSSSNWN